MRSAWATIFTLVIAMVAARRCNGARTATRDFQEQIRNSFIYRSRSIPSITTKRLTSKTSRKSFVIAVVDTSRDRHAEKLQGILARLFRIFESGQSESAGVPSPLGK